MVSWWDRSGSRRPFLDLLGAAFDGSGIPRRSAGLSFVRTWSVIVEFSEHFLRLIRLLDIRTAACKTV
jgi:hypothetical protein